MRAFWKSASRLASAPGAFMKILVANRSEIACRVFQACRELGFKTVGIVAPGDEARVM